MAGSLITWNRHLLHRLFEQQILKSSDFSAKNFSEHEVITPDFKLKFSSFLCGLYRNVEDDVCVFSIGKVALLMISLQRLLNCSEFLIISAVCSKAFSPFVIWFPSLCLFSRKMKVLFLKRRHGMCKNVSQCSERKQFLHLWHCVKWGKFDTIISKKYTDNPNLQLFVSTFIIAVRKAI